MYIKLIHSNYFQIVRKTTMNYTRFITSVSQKRQPSLIRELTNLLNTASPELVFLASGLPNPKLFPFENAKIQLQDGQSIDLDSKLMSTCLQYGPTLGHPPLLKQLKELTLHLHNPPNWSDKELLVTTGSQDGLCKTIEMMINPYDYVITQEPCYTGTLSILNPLSPKYLPVECDHEGLIPQSLKAALASWNPKEICQSTENVPKVLYVNPTGGNPTGVSIPTERRHEIYEIAREYNLIILEDDPYYFVQFNDVKNYPPSFLSLDTDGRVLRYDSFSKVLSSGIRLGYVTGPKPLIERIMLHKQVSDLHASSLSQVLVSELFSKWGIDGFLNHTQKVQEFYQNQRDAMVEAANKHLSDLCEWAVPTGGMFLWMKVKDVKNTYDMIINRNQIKLLWE